MIRTGGSDKARRAMPSPATFAVMFTGRIMRGQHVPELGWLISPVDLTSPAQIDRVAEIAKQRPVLLDSGAFTIASTTARERGISIPEAFQLPLEAHMTDTYREVEAAYRTAIDVMGDDLWGFIEMDLGTPAERDAVRERDRERYPDGPPLPVFHPAAEPFDVFEDLQNDYDRLCIGGIAKLWGSARLDLFVALRRRVRPDRWYHYLGVGPTHLLLALAPPLVSADATTWTRYQRPWMGGKIGASMLRTMGPLIDDRWRYQPGNASLPPAQLLGLRQLAAAARMWQDITEARGEMVG